MSVTGLAFVAPASSAGATDAGARPAGTSSAGNGTIVGAAETCADETYVWTGRARLGDGTNTVDTGVGVPSVAGTRLAVVGTSADGLDAAGTARALPVSVGGTVATVGAVLTGGAIVISFDQGTTPVDVAGATVVVRRCTTVASASPASPTAPTASAGGNGSTSASSGTSASAASLPRTGGDDTRQLLVGSGLVALGSAMVAFGRRRPTA